jgi:hypothetical protein
VNVIARRVAVVAIPLELAALLGFLSCPIDVGYPPGTPRGLIAFGTAGAVIHYPVLVLSDRVPMPPGILLSVLCFVIGYFDLFLFLFCLVLCYRVMQRFLRRNAPR